MFWPDLIESSSTRPFVRIFWPDLIESSSTRPFVRIVFYSAIRADVLVFFLSSIVTTLIYRYSHLKANDWH